MVAGKGIPRRGSAVGPELLEEREEGQDRALRPVSFEEFEGQEGIVANLKLYITAARERGESMDHVLLSGMPGLGKTTLASLIAHAMDAGFTTTSGPGIRGLDTVFGFL